MNNYLANVLLKFCCILLLASCVHTDRATSNFKLMLNNSVNLNITEINLEGAYHEKNEEGYILQKPIYFFKNGLLFYEFGNVPDSAINDKWMRKYLREKTEWGTYNIIGDTINACIYFKYLGGAASFRLTYFQGIIKDKETITQWHVVEPYPKMEKYLRKDYDFLFTKNTDLYFKPLSMKPFIDSVSEKAWILKYRNKK